MKRRTRASRRTVLLFSPKTKPSSPFDDPSSTPATSLSLENKLQILALESPAVLRIIEKIVDGALDELNRRRGGA